MLKGVSPLLSPDLVQALCAMGHGHRIAIVDANYPLPDGPARIMRIVGARGPEILDAILSLTPVEINDDTAACRMIVDGDPDKMLPVLGEFEQTLRGHEPSVSAVKAIPPDTFKKMAAESFAIVMSGDTRVYGNFMVTKGVVTA